MNSSLETVPWQCKCQPGFEIKNDGGKPQCKVCEKGLKSSGVKCEKCSPGHVALAGKHYYIWTNNTLPKGFTAKCSGDCSIKVSITLWIHFLHFTVTTYIVPPWSQNKVSTKERCLLMGGVRPPTGRAC